MDTLKRLQSEAKFLNMINCLAECYGVKVKVDMKTHIACFDGNPDQCILLADKLCEIFKEEKYGSVSFIPDASG